MIARVVNLHWTEKEDRVHDVFVGRPSIWGNPYVLGRDGTRDEVIALYEAWIRRQPRLVARARRELRGKVLACYCKPLACHGDVLLRIANEEE